MEAHGRALCTAAARARARYQQKVEEQNRELDERTYQAMDAVKFAEEVGDKVKFLSTRTRYYVHIYLSTFDFIVILSGSFMEIFS